MKTSVPFLIYGGTVMLKGLRELIKNKERLNIIVLSKQKGEDAITTYRRLLFEEPGSKKILQLMAEGHTAKTIGKIVFKAPRTIEAYIWNLKHESNCKTLVQMMYIACKLKIIG